MKIRIIVINPDNSLTIKKIKPKTFDIEINKNKYVLTNKDIMLRDTFLGLQRYAVFYQGNPISITNDITELSKNENDKYVTEIKDTKREITRLNKSLNKLKEAYDIMLNNTSK